MTNMRYAVGPFVFYKKTNTTYEQKEKRTLPERYLHAIFKPVGSATSIFKADIKKSLLHSIHKFEVNREMINIHSKR